tara:strand:- start:1058 stop:1270 length:213 start_codon:yes stop_codon:yes gene_type:complete
MDAFQELIKKAAPIMAAVQSLFFYVITFSAIGYYLDKKFKTFPILFIILLFVGLFAGFSQLYIMDKKGRK